MPKVFVGLLFVVALSAQVTTIPATAGGGGGPITSGRVAFGDGTSTPATDSQFVWDNTNKRFQVGNFTNWTGYEPFVRFSNVDTRTAATVGYQDFYSNILETNYGDITTGVSGADIYTLVVNSKVSGNTDTTAAGGGVNSIVSSAFITDTAKVDYIYGLQGSAYTTGTSSVNNIVGTFAGITVGAGTTATNAFGLKVVANGTATNSWAISSESSWPSRVLGKLAIGESNSAAPTSTLYVKDATASTGATTVQFDIGAGQSSTSTILTLGGVIRFNGQNTTGAGSASLGSNSPAVTNTAPYTWIRIVTSDGSTGYFPVWK